MVFSSISFVFAFLPLVLAAYFLVGRSWKNGVLLAASLLFYFWGAGKYTPVIVLSMVMNYGFALWVEAARGTRLPVAVAVAANLGLLACFKYSAFALQNVQAVSAWAGLASPTWWTPPPLLGVSFFTFQAMSYVIDVHRGDTAAERNPLRVALYIALFPQLVAGPIVLFREVSRQLGQRSVGLDDFAEGVRRFVVGLGKKVLIADTLALPVEEIFGSTLQSSALTPGLAWLGVLFFALQIYYDFSGYSDMAVGLGRMFGFHFPENFDYPYVSQSIAEFWTRWHMSLTNWFRSYLFFPVASAADGRPQLGQGSILLVFLAIGLWHGASWTFVLFGLWCGLLFVAEVRGLGAWLKARPRPLRHLYTLAGLAVGLVLFRCPTFTKAALYLGAMAGVPAQQLPPVSPLGYLDPATALVIACALIGCGPALPRLEAWAGALVANSTGRASRLLQVLLSGGRVAFLTGVLGLSAARMAAATHIPFIYFQF